MYRMQTTEEKDNLSYGKAYDIRRKMEADRRKLDRELTRGMTKRETEALRKNLDKILNNIADP